VNKNIGNIFAGMWDLLKKYRWALVRGSALGTVIGIQPGSGAAPVAPSISPSQKKRAAIEAAAQAVLDARASFPEASLADLYDPLAMPPALSKAHQQLDKAVDAAYAYKGQPDDASRVAFLFGLYEQMTSALSVQNVQRSKRLPTKVSHV